MKKTAIEDLITRNQGNVLEVSAPSFWINDVKQTGGDCKIEVSFFSKKLWLKVSQSNSKTCKIFPIDGNHGVFNNQGLPVAQPDDFQYTKTSNGVEVSERAGDCDCLITQDKWHLIEFKTNAYSSDLRQIKQNQDKAVMQLARTLTALKEQLANPPEVICVLVAPSVWPKTAAMNMPQAEKFRKSYGSPLKTIQAGAGKAYPLD